MGGAPVYTIHNPAAITSDRETALLQGLGRLEFMSSQMIKALYYQDAVRWTMQRHLNHLLKIGLIWRTKTHIEHLRPRETGANGRLKPPPKSPYIYGLTPEGKNHLATLAVEPYALSFDALRTRDRRAPDVAKAQLTHDLLASAWCVSLIDAARRCAMLDGVFCHVEYVSDARQRIDALLMLRFNMQQRTQSAPGWLIPWHDGTPDGPHHRTVRFALEIDRGTEQLKILMAKGLMYRTLTAENVYQKTLGGPVTPVFLVPPGKRAAQIAREWQAAWPGGAGIISNPIKANHPEYGVLWGEYFTMTDTPAKPYRLLNALVPSVDAWAKLVQNWNPAGPELVTGGQK